MEGSSSFHHSPTKTFTFRPLAYLNESPASAQAGFHFQYTPSPTKSSRKRRRSSSGSRTGAEFHAQLAKRLNTGIVTHYYFDWLPHEIIAHILSFLSLSELLQTELVSTLWHNILNHPNFWHTKFELTWFNQPLRERCFTLANLTMKRMAYMRYKVELHHFIVDNRHASPRTAEGFVTWGDQLCREAEHASSANDREWLWYFAMQQYHSAVSLDAECALAFDHWAQALLEVAAFSRDRPLVEELADEKRKQADALNVDVNSADMDESFGGTDMVLSRSSSTMLGANGDLGTGDDMESMLGFGWC